MSIYFYLSLQWGFVVSEAPASAGKVARSGVEDLLCQLGPCPLSLKASCSGGSAPTEREK